MVRFAAIIWILSATVFAGAFVLAFLMMSPGGGLSAMLLWVALAGAVVAVPFSLVLAKGMLGRTAP